MSRRLDIVREKSCRPAQSTRPSHDSDWDEEMNSRCSRCLFCCVLRVEVLVPNVNPIHLNSPCSPSSPGGRGRFGRRAPNFDGPHFYNHSSIGDGQRRSPLLQTDCVVVVPAQRVPIPPSLYAEETEAPFETCLVCDRPLRDGSTEYVIEKGYRSFDAYDVEETVFGYALCMGCHSTLSQSFSAASRQRCQSYLHEHVDLRARTASLLGADSPAPEQWTERCIVHGTPKEELEAYQILAHCHGDDLLLTHLPVLLGGRAVDALVQRLSNETLDELGGFRDEYFGLPPELRGNLQGPVLA